MNRFQLTPAKGALLAVFMMLALVVGWAAHRSNLGFGPTGDVVFALGTLAFLILVGSSVGWGLLAVARRLPPWSPGVLLAAGAGGAFVMGILVPHPLARIAIFVVVLLVGWVGAAATLFVQRGLAATTLTRFRLASGAHLIFALGVSGVVGLWVGMGSQASPLPFARIGTLGASLVSGENPGARGALQVETLSYGSGSDRRRSAYGDSVTVRSPTLDLRPLLSGFRGWEADAHRAYWGFGLNEVPMNARLWLPKGEAAPAPLVLVIPGINSGMDEAELGYAYLADLLASRGFAVVAIDVNFLGGPRISQWAQEMPVRAWLALEHLAFLRAWQDADPSGPMGRVDLERIALLGHSRGGEAAAIAARLNTLERYPADATIPVSFGFGIRSVVALAPTDGYRWAQGRGTDLENVDYLVLHGSQDSDVLAFFGAGQFERVSVTGENQGLKAAIYLLGANHSQFNADRDGQDQPGFLAAFLDRGRVLPGEVQRSVTTTLVSAFLEVSLNEVEALRPMLRDPRLAGSWLPSVEFVSRVEDGRTRVVANFEEDDDPATATLSGASLLGQRLAVWREEAVRLRDPARTRAGNTVVHLGWRAEPNAQDRSEYPSFDVQLPPDFSERTALESSGALTFSMGLGVSEIPRLPAIVVEVISSGGSTARVPLSQYGSLPVPQQARIWRIPLLDRWLMPESETVLQSFEIPLSDFEAVRPGLNLRAIDQVRFVFEPTGWGSVLLDDIGFRSTTVEIKP